MYKAGAILYLFISLTSCDKGENVILRIDLAREHDEGRFNPDAGDQVFIAGNFNDWQSQSVFLTDTDGDWVYETTLSEIPDTVSFKFGIQSSVNKDLANGGWEVVPNRSVVKEVLVSDAPVFEFNRSWKRNVEVQIPFAVSMSNQQVLGFFDPDKDKVVVTGSFMGWDPIGITLKDEDKDLIYEATVPVSIKNGKPEQYKYRIAKNESSTGYLPNNGWEFLDDRLLISEEERVDYFNNQKRIARFQISEAYLQDSLNVTMKKGDILQIRLTGSDFDFLSSEMIETKEGKYETSVQISMNVSNFKWYITKNTNDYLFESRYIVVTQNGRVFSL